MVSTWLKHQTPLCLSLGFFIVGCSAGVLDPNEPAPDETQQEESEILTHKIYQGAAFEGSNWSPEAIDEENAQVGKRMSILHFGRNPYQSPSLPVPSELTLVRSKGAIPMVSFALWRSSD